MNDFYEQMCDAVSIRQSHRHFTQTDLSSDHEQAILAFLDKLTVPFPHNCKISYHKTNQNTSIVYFKGPHQFIALESPKSIEEQAKLGFLGEHIVLYAESIGVRTCWMGHYNKKNVNDIVYGNKTQDGDSQLYCIILLGYVPEKTGVLDRFSKRRFSNKNRSIDSFLHPDSDTEFPEFIQYSLSLSSRAPSAMNSQKWYYHISKVENGHLVELGKIKGYRHFKWPYYDIDVGTAAAHLWLGLMTTTEVQSVTCASHGSDSTWCYLVHHS